MFEGFELVEEEQDYVVVDKEQSDRNRQTVVIPSIKLNSDYEKLLHQNSVVATKLRKMVYSFEKEGVSGNNLDLWLAAANCVIKCMDDVIVEGEKLITEKT